MLVDIPNDVIAHFRKLAFRTAKFDDDEFEVYAHAGGNVDDAYALGEHDGEISCARSIVAFLSASPDTD